MNSYTLDFKLLAEISYVNGCVSWKYFDFMAAFQAQAELTTRMMRQASDIAL